MVTLLQWCLPLLSLIAVVVAQLNTLEYYSRNVCPTPALGNFSCLDQEVQTGNCFGTGELCSALTLPPPPTSFFCIGGEDEGLNAALSSLECKLATNMKCSVHGDDDDDISILNYC